MHCTKKKPIAIPLDHTQALAVVKKVKKRRGCEKQIHRHQFARVVREILEDQVSARRESAPAFRIQTSGLDMIQYAAEDYLIELFARAANNAEAKKRRTVVTRDLRKADSQFRLQVLADSATPVINW